MFISENPAVVSYAAERELAAVVVVCCSGWPEHAVARLLRQLSSCGWPLRAQDDLDRDGVRIHRHLVHAHGAASWRYDMSTYQAGLRRAHPGDAVGSPTTACRSARR